MKKTITASTLAITATTALAGCDMSITSTYPSGQITELSYKEEWIETDCTLDSFGDLDTCTAEVVEDCNLVRFINEDGVELSDCTDKTMWKTLDIGNDYTDD